jgi:hypothetical protein
MHTSIFAQPASLIKQRLEMALPAVVLFNVYRLNPPGVRVFKSEQKGSDWSGAMQLDKVKAQLTMIGKIIDCLNDQVVN